jgi:two-component system response regulator YesN
LFKVLLVDDERIILDGISQIVPWEQVGTALAGIARNGLEAFEHIERDPPDIVISDIKMPGMDGLQLVANTVGLYPHIRFILLSGFDEFEYAQTAMNYGVRHYLLKPCNEETITKALREVVGECESARQKEQFVSRLKYGMEKVLPHVKEQFLKEFVTNKTYGERDWEYFRTLFDLRMENPKVRLILFQLEGAFEFEHLFAVKNIAEEILEKPLLSSTVGEHVLVVVEEAAPPEELQARIHSIRKTFYDYYKIDLTVALSEADAITKARQLFKQTQECLHYRFYLGEGSLITKKDINLQDDQRTQDQQEISLDEETLLLQIKAGRWEDALQSIDEFFGRIVAVRLDIHTAKTYVIQLFMAIIRLCDANAIHDYMSRLMMLMETNTMQSMHDFFKQAACEIAQKQYEQNKNKHSAIVDKVIQIIQEHLGDPQLSLTWVANQMLYMNTDYLGKLFKKETGEKFSAYVTKLRIAKAAEMIVRQEDVKIFELAEKLGFGDNPQYFSQVFKKYTGCTPSEYMKSPL